MCHGPCESKDMFFLFFTWPSDQIVAWPCSWDFLILSYHPATFRVRRPCENWDITFFICHVTTWLCWCGFFILSHQPAKFIARAIGLMEMEIIAFIISVPIPIPMPRFQCQGLQMFKNLWWIYLQTTKE